MLALHPLGQLAFDEEIALYVRLGVLTMGGVLVVYGNKATESQSARRTNGRRTTIISVAIGWAF